VCGHAKLIAQMRRQRVMRGQLVRNLFGQRPVKPARFINADQLFAFLFWDSGELFCLAGPIGIFGIGL
jgi:hypothetical protein